MVQRLRQAMVLHMVIGHYGFDIGPDPQSDSGQSILALRLLDLVCSARLTTLDTGLLASQGMGAQLERLWEGAARFECAGGVPLAAVLKTGFEGLSQAGAIVLLVVEAANPRALYLASGRSIPVREGVTGPMGTSGPYLALLTVEADVFGKSCVRSASVMPVLRRDLLFPLVDETERLVLTALVELIERLDCHGIALRVRRTIVADRCDCMLQCTVGTGSTGLRFLVDPCSTTIEGLLPGPGRKRDLPVVQGDVRALHSGRFISDIQSLVLKIADFG